MSNPVPLCYKCVNYCKLYDDGTYHETRCKLNGSQSGTFMNVFAEGDCDGYATPKIQIDADRYPLRRHDNKSVDTARSDYDTSLRDSLTIKEQMRDTPMFRRKKHFGTRRKK